ncbi:MAG: 4-hydroxy-3-methylbut-2-enyl diphosphate reductase [Akkermansia sp.]
MDRPAKRPVNVRRPEIMEAVQEDLGEFCSSLVQDIRAAGNVLRIPNTQFFLADSFGFCDGVRRAIEIAYAARRLFRDRRIWLIGEIIHNPEVNARLDAMGLLRLPWDMGDPLYRSLGTEDVVIIPAFGLPVPMRLFLEAQGVQLVDSTCGNVVKVWSRVRQYAAAGVTSIIHGKARHEETVATASQARGKVPDAAFLIISNEEEAHQVADYMLGRSTREAFLARFADRCSEGFDPDRDLRRIGIANQTTMLKSETSLIQELLRRAVVQRDGDGENFHAFNTICSATQDRQNALMQLLEKKPDAMIIIGGYNSSNTTHLAQIAARHVRTYFIKSAESLISVHDMCCWDFESRSERHCALPAGAGDASRLLRIGITAGASCPDNVIESVIRRLAELRGYPLPLC